jgi:hypothetical protein
MRELGLVLAVLWVFDFLDMSSTSRTSVSYVKSSVSSIYIMINEELRDSLAMSLGATSGGWEWVYCRSGEMRTSYTGGTSCSL